MNYYSEGVRPSCTAIIKTPCGWQTMPAWRAPQNPKAHELISLALFALGNYGPAASEAHAGMALGPIADWNDLFGYYKRQREESRRLGSREVHGPAARALEKASAQDPKSAAEHFLLGYHYLMIRARDKR